MAFCGVCAYSTSKSPVFILFIRIYIIETPNFNSTMNKNITNRVSQSLDLYQMVKADKSLANRKEVARYDLNGIKLSSPQKRVNIILYSDGKSNKVIEK